MSQPRPDRLPPHETVSRPGLVDFLAVFAGVALSLHMLRLAPLTAGAPDGLDWRVRQIFDFLPDMMRLPEGVILLWPVFFATQWLRRTQGLTPAEWLWLLAWVGQLLLALLVTWQAVLGLPEAIQGYADKPRVLWYMLVAPALGVLALLVLLLDVFRSSRAPWTHALALALLIWPAVPALLILVAGEMGKKP